MQITHLGCICGDFVFSYVCVHLFFTDYPPSWEKIPPVEDLGLCDPPSFIHQVIIITGLNKLQLYVLALKMALDADRA